MNRSVYIVGLIGLILAPSFLYGNLRVEDVVDSLVSHYKNFNTIHACITQRIKKGGTEWVYKGKYWAKDNEMYIEYTYPYFQRVWVKRDSVVWYVPKKKKVYLSVGSKNKSNSVSTSNMKNIINDIEKELQQYMKIKMEEKGIIKKKYVISIIPKDRTNKGGLQIIVDKNNFLLNDYIIYDNNAREILHFTFKNYSKVNNDVYLPMNIVSKWYISGYMEVNTRYNDVRINGYIPDSLFVIDIPDSVITEPLKLF